MIEAARNRLPNRRLQFGAGKSVAPQSAPAGAARLQKRSALRFSGAVSAHDVLVERAETRALLWAENLIETIPAAVDPLQQFAKDSGLAAEIGQDAVQKILADAFAPYRCEQQNDTDNAQPVIEQRANESLGALWDRLNDPRRRSIPQSTIEAFRYVVKYNSPEQAQAWLSRRRPDERAMLRKLLSNEQQD